MRFSLNASQFVMSSTGNTVSPKFEICERSITPDVATNKYLCVFLLRLLPLQAIIKTNIPATQMSASRIKSVEVMDILVLARGAYLEGRPRGCQEDRPPSFCGRSSLRVTVTCKLSSIPFSSREILAGIRSVFPSIKQSGLEAGL